MRPRAPPRPPVARRPAPARDGCDESAQRRAARPRGPWWWRPRIRSALALGALGLGGGRAGGGGGGGGAGGDPRPPGARGVVFPRTGGGRRFWAPLREPVARGQPRR